MELAPVVLFVYKRQWHTRQTIESLQKNELARDTELFIFSDGPKSEDDEKDVQAVREYIKIIRGFKKVTIINQEKNLGLADSIINGVTELCNKYGRVIVLEDDLLVSRYFLEYMNGALDRYESNERVMQISGYMFPITLKVDTDAVFLPFTTSWGWATWNRAWVYFDRDMKSYDILKKDPTLRRRFDLNNSYPYFKMFKAQVHGKIDSWAIRWYLSVFMRGGLTLYPVKSLVYNIGFDNSGTHTRSVDKINSELMTNFQVQRYPADVDVSSEVFTEVKKLLKNRKRGLLPRLKESLIRFIWRKI